MKKNNKNILVVLSFGFMFCGSFILMFAMSPEENAERNSKVFDELKDVFNEFENEFERMLIEKARQNKESFNELVRSFVDGVRQDERFLSVPSQVDEAIAAARIAINYAEDDATQGLGVALFLSLLAHNKGVVAAGKAAQAAIFSNNDKKQKLGLLLFTELVKQKKAIKEAVDTARAAIYYVDKNDSILELSTRRLGLDLFTILIKQKKGMPEGITAAQLASQGDICFRSDNSDISDIVDIGINLFKVLLEDTDAETKKIVTEHIEQVLNNESIQETIKIKLQKLIE